MDYSPGFRRDSPVLFVPFKWPEKLNFKGVPNPWSLTRQRRKTFVWASSAGLIPVLNSDFQHKIEMKRRRLVRVSKEERVRF